MDEIKIKTLVSQLDTKNSLEQESAWAQLRQLGIAVVPYLADFYPHAKKLEGRRVLVFHAIKYARTSDAAFELGITALNDRASVVRYRACSILAYSLRRQALPHLETLLTHQDLKTAEDARSAIDAIKHNNHHYFIDRNHSGRSFWMVNDSDKTTA